MSDSENDFHSHISQAMRSLRSNIWKPMSVFTDSRLTNTMTTVFVDFHALIGRKCDMGFAWSLDLLWMARVYCFVCSIKPTFWKEPDPHLVDHHSIPLYPLPREHSKMSCIHQKLHPHKKCYTRCVLWSCAIINIHCTIWLKLSYISNPKTNKRRNIY